ncbi:MAG: hypothetical protein ABIZ70_01770 [Gemmatimonadales bacterium]
MTQPGFDPTEMATLLAAQIADLARYRHVVEAQHSVLRMGEAGMLEVFAAEADGIISDLSAREVRLLAIRAAAQSDLIPHAPSLAALRAQVETERAGAGAAAAELARQMEIEARSVAKQLEDTHKALDQLLSGYSQRKDDGGPVLLDRTG